MGLGSKRARGTPDGVWGRVTCLQARYFVLFPSEVVSLPVKIKEKGIF